MKRPRTKSSFFLSPLVMLFILLSLPSCGEQNTTPVLSSNAELSSLVVSVGNLYPTFTSNSTAYDAIFVSESSITVTPTAAASGATILVNGSTVPSGQVSGAIILSLGQNIVTVQVTAEDGVTTKTYSINAGRPSLEAYIKSSNTGMFDGFGWSMAISGDTLVVGAPAEASNATGISGDQSDDSKFNSGAVYVFTRTGTIWTQQAYIKASNTDADDEFGYSVALDGDTLVVGAPYEASNARGIGGNQDDNSASWSGAVYVFTRSGSAWTQQAYIKASNADEGDAFGYSVALTGDTLAVGALYERSSALGVNGNQDDNSMSSCGAAYVFTRSGTMWSQQAYIKASNTGNGDQFGFRVAVSADTLAVGAIIEESNATGVNGDQTDNSMLSSGAVYVFTRSGGTWTQQAYLKASNTQAGVWFGTSLSISGETLAVGADGESSAGSRGAVYVFTRSGSTWTQQAYLKASNTGGAFGYSVALSGDTLAVGAFDEGSNATGINGNQNDTSLDGCGAVYMFTRAGTTWTQQVYIKASNAEAEDWFGHHVALSLDTLAVGAPSESSSAIGINGNQSDNSAPRSGAVYVFPSI